MEGAFAYRAYVTYKAYMAHGKFDKLKNSITSEDLLDANFEHRRTDKKFFVEVESHVGRNRWKLYTLFAAYWQKRGGFYIAEYTQDAFDSYKRLSSELRNRDFVFERDLKLIIGHCKDEGMRPKDYFYDESGIPEILRDKSVSWVSKTLLDLVFDWGGKTVINKNEMNKLERKKAGFYKKSIDRHMPFLYNVMKQPSSEYYKKLTKQILLEATV